MADDEGTFVESGRSGVVTVGPDAEGGEVTHARDLDPEMVVDARAGDVKANTKIGDKHARDLDPDEPVQVKAGDLKAATEIVDNPEAGARDNTGAEMPAPTESGGNFDPQLALLWEETNRLTATGARTDDLQRAVQYLNDALIANGLAAGPKNDLEAGPDGAAADDPDVAAAYEELAANAAAQTGADVGAQLTRDDEARAAAEDDEVPGVEGTEVGRDDDVEVEAT